jgi:hypothetical protein
VAEAERHFPAAIQGALGRVLKHFYGSTQWRLASTAPFNCDVQLCMSGDDGSHIIPFSCRQTDAGWINADLDVRLDIEPSEWRAWPAWQAAPVRSEAHILQGRRLQAAAFRPRRVRMVQMRSSISAACPQ